MILVLEALLRSGEFVWSADLRRRTSRDENVERTCRMDKKKKKNKSKDRDKQLGEYYWDNAPWQTLDTHD